MVVADTSVWIPFFNEPESVEKRELDALIDADRLVMVGVVLAEPIQGCRTAWKSTPWTPTSRRSPAWPYTLRRAPGAAADPSPTSGGRRAGSPAARHPPERY